MKEKYLVIAGVVYSKDGDKHFISAYQLCELYGLNPAAENVRLADETRPVTLKFYDDTWIHLYPRSDGNYQKIICHTNYQKKRS